MGNGTAQAMTTNSTATQSYWDGYTYCSVPGQLYIGGFYRTTGATTAAAQVTATVPAALIDASGDTIPFSKIQWTSSGNGDTGAEPFPAGTFVNGGVQNVGSMGSNTWNESCWTFSYLNNTVPPAGTFTGRRSLHAECAMIARCARQAAAAFFFGAGIEHNLVLPDAGQDDHDR